MKPSLSYILLLIFALSLSKSPIVNALFDKFSVHIVNGFMNNDTLETHCKSGDDDLGVHHIAVHEEYMWKFRINFKSTTLYFCNMWWVGGRKVYDVFKVDDKFLGKFCGFDFCRWLTKEEGIFAYNEKKKKYIFAYKWDP